MSCDMKLFAIAEYSPKKGKSKVCEFKNNLQIQILELKILDNLNPAVFLMVLKYIFLKVKSTKVRLQSTKISVRLKNVSNEKSVL